jgi:hypothetical protein
MKKALVLPLLAVILAFGLFSPAAMAKEEKETKTPPEAMIQLSPVAVPIVRDGRVINYVFVSIKVQLKPQADAMKLREKEPYFRDVLVRGANRVALGDPKDPNRVDEAKVKAVLLQGAAGFMDVGMIKDIQFMFQAPKRRLPIPSSQSPSTPSGR